MTYKGYFAYHGIGPHCPSDAIFVKDNEVIRAEIRTGLRTKYGELRFPRKPIDTERSDVYIIVVDWNDIEIVPIKNHRGFNKNQNRGPISREEELGL